MIPPTFPIRHAFDKKTSSYDASSRGRSGHVHLSDTELGSGLRGDYRSAFKSRGYVDHSVNIPGNESTVNLPNNAIMMKQDVQIKTEYTTTQVVEKSTSRSVSHTPSKRSSENYDSEVQEPYNTGRD